MRLFRGDRAHARRMAAALALLLLLGAGALAFGQVSGTFAIFTAETENQGGVAQGGWIPAPSAPSSSLDGSPYSQEHLSWVSGASTTMPSGANPVTGQTILYADGGSGASASCGSYSTFTTVSATATSADLTGSSIADWWCFQAYSTSASLWTSGTTTFAPRRLFVPTGTVVFTNRTLSGYAYNGDTIAITFNQTPADPGTIAVQVCNSGTIQLGSSSCAAAGSIGTITGLSIGSSVSFPSSTAAVTGSTLTLTLGGGGFFSFSRITGTGSFTAGSGATSSGGQQACTAAGTCSVATSGSF